MKFSASFVIFACIPVAQGNMTYPKTAGNMHKLAFANAPKIWFKYVERLSVNELSKLNTETYLSCVIFVFKRSTESLEKRSRHLEISSNTNRSEALRLYLPRGIGNMNIAESNASVSRPVGLTGKLRNTSDPIYDLPIAVNHQWLFRLSKDLRLNLTFNSVHFDVTACSAGFLDIIDSKQKTLDRYCGILSEFQNFPLVGDVNVFLFVCSGFVYNLTFSFSVIDSHRLHTYYLWSEKKGNAHPSWVWFLHRENTHVERYILQVKKHYKMTVQMPPTGETQVHLEVYDGPGALCEKIKPSQIRHVQSIVYKTSSFQCLIYKWSLEGYLVYLPRRVPVHQISLNSSWRVALPHKICSNSVACPVHMVLVDKMHHINVTIDQLIFKGIVANRLCDFAGFSAFNVMGRSSYRHMSTECVPNDKTLYKYRPLYSETNSLLIVVYSYKEYGVISVNISISNTRCFPVNVNLCERKTLKTTYLRERSGRIEVMVPEGKCVVLQTTHRVIATQCWLIHITSQMCTREVRHVPQHEPGRIIEYQVTGFFSGEFFFLFFDQTKPMLVHLKRGWWFGKICWCLMTTFEVKLVCCSDLSSLNWKKWNQDVFKRNWSSNSVSTDLQTTLQGKITH